jgi:hypothetical protein
MIAWEFLIQREGDRGWRQIRTGNLQLMEGKYRIVAKSNLFDTQIQTRVTHQTLDSTVPQRRSQSCNQTSNPRGLIVIIPFTHLHSGIWQFVCSGTTVAQTAWHQILKLRVLRRTPTQSPVDPLDQRSLAAPRMHQQRDDIDRNDDITPTQPIIPISIVGEQENWADGLDRLLEQLERDSLQPPAVRQTLAGAIQLQSIIDRPSQLISLDRSTFSGIMPGNRLTITGACNLRLVDATLVQAVTVEKLSICLRHPQTAEIIVSIQQSLPPHLDTFAFSGQLTLPTEPKISLLLGEANLYDRHNIQLGSSGFTVTLNLNPLQESELSLLQLFDRHTDRDAATLGSAGERLRQQLTQELQLETATIGLNQSMSRPPRPTTPSTIQPLNSAQYPPVPLAYRRESLFTHPDIVPVKSSSPSPAVDQKINPQSQPVTLDFTGDLEIDFARATFIDRHDTHTYQNLEIVVDD